ncbi:MAG: pyruvate ferredoxin oxidoreductase [Planctomycetota bacterium]|nr:pyruvate ferredoxin oxidoreductase [Planctomycetota bacterium]
MKKVIMGNHAVSYGVRLARAEVIAAYPITPQTQIVEELSEMCSDGRLKAKFVKVESEHSAMACCIGAASAGARAFTATSSQGLALMHELLHWASAARLPIVMTNVNRALGPGWNIWTEQTDSLAQRDTGWVQLYCEDNQEVLDSTLMAFRVAEAVRLPVMIVYDAFFLSHTYEPVDIPSQEDADALLPPRKLEKGTFMDIEDPRTFSNMTPPDYFMEMRFKLERAMRRAKDEFGRAAGEWKKLTGRDYAAIETYRCGDAETVLVAASTAVSTARVVVDSLRGKGRKVGLLKMRMFRPFPYREVVDVLRRTRKVAVLDRNISFGSGGIFATEIKAALSNVPGHPPVYGYIAGLGGRDITPGTIEEIFDRTDRNGVPDDPITWIGLKP